MEIINEFLNENVLLTVIISAVIGILASWYISKHFFLRKSPSILQLAKRDKVANFGNHIYTKRKTKIEYLKHDFFGEWHIKSDGTITDVKNKLCWIRAPWGTTWNGEEFMGSPTTINWRDASNLFGRGSFIEVYRGTKPFQLNRVTSKENYKKGSCKVSFAEANTWRLPTASEYTTLLFHVPEEWDIDKINAFRKVGRDMRNKLFPEIENYGPNYCFWSADEAGSNCAWVSAGLNTLDDLRYHQKYAVLFVRKMTAFEVKKEKEQLSS